MKRRLDLETHETERDREKELESEQANKRKKKGERKRAGGFILHKSQVELPSKATSRRSRGELAEPENKESLKSPVGAEV